MSTHMYWRRVDFIRDEGECKYYYDNLQFLLFYMGIITSLGDI